MKKFHLAGRQASRIAQGCMRIANLSQQELDRLIRTDLEVGINFFDHADIYGKGSCESLFGDFLARNPGLRDQMVIQTKCAIHDGMYDFSKEHILQSVDNSLKKLRTEKIDFLLLHRPDTLFEPEEVAEAFATLKAQGKADHFGVSNENAMQMALLNKYLQEPVCINQLQFGLGHTGLVDAGFNVNMQKPESAVRDGSVLEYCRLHDITIQPWSPLQYGFFEGTIIGSDRYPELNRMLVSLAEEYGVTPTGMAIAWILRHPACMQPVVGSTNPDRIREIARASDVAITRQQWYGLYRATGKTLP